MDAYTRLVSGVLFPLQERLKGHATVSVRRRLERTQWWSSERLERLQSERLQRLVRRAGRQVPFYQDVFAQSGVSPHDIREPADLRRLPVLTKDAIRANVDRLKARDARGLVRLNTGGSGGDPLVFFVGKERISHDVAAKWRATRWWGVDIGDPEIVAWGSPIELGAQDRIKKARDHVMRTRLLPAFEMSEANLDEFLDAIERMRPKMLFGYPSALSLIARHAEKRGRSLRGAGCIVAFVTAERLYDSQKAQIERTYGCRVANGYGGRDAGFVAHECPAGRLHITAEDTIVEVLDRQDRPVPSGEAGELVITHLATGDFPFIRYRTGDVGALGHEACPCGRGLPVLQEVQGRTTDFVIGEDGTVMHGLALIYVVRDIEGVQNFKIVQHSIGYTEVLLQVAEGFPESRLSAIREGIQARIGQSVTVEIRTVPRVEPEPSGKFRYVVSRVAPSAS